MAFLILPHAIATLGDEFQVNTYTTSVQCCSAIAMDTAGNFIVAWASDGQDGSGYGVFAQRYAADGTPLGGEFQVNTFTTGAQFAPAVAMDADGDFVVAWYSGGQDGSGSGIFAQRYDAAATPQGSEFQVNTYTTGNQWNPAAAMDANGNFVVVWRSDDQDGSLSGVFGQRLDASGTPQGSEFQVNTYTTDNQYAPAVAMDADGDFVVVWSSGAGLDIDIFAQGYAADGTPQGSEFQVNTYTTSSQVTPAVAMDAAGDFVVVWRNDVPDQEGYGGDICAQRYDAAGVPQGVEFQVNTDTTGIQSGPAIAMDPNGNFVLVWESWYPDGDQTDVFAQRFAANGTPLRNEFQVNTYTTNDPINPAVATDAITIVAVWQSFGQDGDGWGIFGRGFLANPAAFTGKVKDARRNPLAGALVEAKQGGVTLFSTVSGANGSYTLEVAGGTYDLVASLAGYLDTAKPGMAIGAGQTLTKVKFKLFRPSFFQGTVTEKGTGTPLDGALVEAVKSGATVASAMTAADGTYSLQVTKGTYTLRASKAGYKTKQKLHQTIGDGKTKTGVNFALAPL